MFPLMRTTTINLNPTGLQGKLHEDWDYSMVTPMLNPC